MYGFILLVGGFILMAGLFGIVSSAVSIGFVSLFLSVAGMLISVVCICGGALLLILLLKLVLLNWKAIKSVIDRSGCFILKGGEIRND